MHHSPVEVGRFVVSPMINCGADGSFVASVSIRSGQGRATTDRVMRFTPSFACPTSALRYALSEGTAWAQRL